MQFNTAKEIIADIARELREDPSRWTQGVYARDEYGRYTSPADANAQQWCLSGHVIRRVATTEDGRCYGLKRDTCDLLRGTGEIYHFPRWNDLPERTVEDVIALCEKAAA